MQYIETYSYIYIVKQIIHKRAAQLLKLCTKIMKNLSTANLVKIGIAIAFIAGIILVSSFIVANAPGNTLIQ